jgi:hypothetical protein
MRTLIGIASALLLFVGLGFAQGSSPAFGSIRGDVFTKGTNGEPAVLPGVRIVLHGPITKETESDAQGAFAIDGLPPGTLPDRSECSWVEWRTRIGHSTGGGEVARYVAKYGEPQGRVAKALHSN